MRKLLSITLLTTALVVPTHAQDIAQIAKSDPLIISGAIGTNNTYHHSSQGSGYASPLSNTVYANLDISIYGMSMPFSLYYSNNNTSFSYPHISFNISPKYKNWQAHFGQSSMAFSSYVMNTSFNGVGLEYNDGMFRGGAFYGTLRSAVNDDPNDPYARTPQYKRIGWGLKVGYGSVSNYVDLYVLKASDRLNSLDERWQQLVSPQNNFVVGLKGAVTPVNFLSFNANVATSAFSVDTRGRSVETDDAKKWSSIFDTKYTSLMRFAGDVSANVNIGAWTTSLFYRMVQPNYTSLGTSYMSNNYQGFGLNVSGSLFSRLSLSAMYSLQQDNLTKKQLYTTSGSVYNLNLGTSIGQNFNINASYNGYLQSQGDGTAKVTDSTRVKRIMNSFSLTPSYSINGAALTHYISASINYTNNKDLSPLATGKDDVNTFAAGVTYDMNVPSWKTNFTTSFNHQTSTSYEQTYTTDILSLSAHRSFLKENNLTLSGTINLVYNKLKKMRENMSLGGNLSCAYTIKKVHAFSLTAGINKMSDVNVSVDEQPYNSTEINASFNYTYTFTLFQIKNKNNKDNEL